MNTGSGAKPSDDSEMDEDEDDYEGDGDDSGDDIDDDEGNDKSQNKMQEYDNNEAAEAAAMLDDTSMNVDNENDTRRSRAKPVRDESQSQLQSQQQVSPNSATNESVSLSNQRLALFKTQLANVMQSTFDGEEAVPVSDLLPELNKGLPTNALFGSTEANQALEQMNERNEIMLSSGVVYRI